MGQLTNKVYIFGLIFLDIILFSVLIFPMQRQRINPEIKMFKEMTDFSKYSLRQSENEKNGDPKNIAFIFGWKDQRKIEKNNSVKIIFKEVDWIKPIGYIVKSNGEKYYIFKNLRENTVFSLSIGDKKGILHLLDEDDEKYIIEIDGKKYKITK